MATKDTQPDTVWLTHANGSRIRVAVDKADTYKGLGYSEAKARKAVKKTTPKTETTSRASESRKSGE